MKSLKVASVAVWFLFVMGGVWAETLTLVGIWTIIKLASYWGFLELSVVCLWHFCAKLQFTV